MLNHLAFVMARPSGSSEQDLIQVIYMIALMITFLYCWFLQECLLDLPVDDRRAAPWSVWLMFLPYIGPVVAWLLIPFRIPASFASFFIRHDLTGKYGDCGRRQGLIWMLCFTMSLPLSLLASQAVGASLGFLGLVMMMTYTWRLMRMRRDVRRYHRAAAAEAHRH